MKLPLVFIILFLFTAPFPVSHAVTLHRSLLTDVPSDWPIHIVDINKDDNDDIITITNSQNIEFSIVIKKYILEGQYDSNTLPLPDRSSFIITDDFNRDGIIDIVTSGHMYLGDQFGNFTSVMLDYTGESGASGDIDNDGFPDLIFGYGTHMQILLNDRNGNFTVHEDRAFEARGLIDVYPFELVDLNIDGYKDLVFGMYSIWDEHNAKPAIPNPEYVLFFMLNTSNGDFDETYHSLGGYDPTFPYKIVDINNDGYPDRLKLAGNLECHLNDGHASFTKCWNRNRDFGMESVN